jgi:formylglycine-generating enzyme required for sulfatase activity
MEAAKPVPLPGWPLDDKAARARQAAAGPAEKTVDLGDGVTLKLVRIPAGAFVMGDAAGEPDERPLAKVTIDRPFWMGACEVTNAQLRRCDPEHDPQYYTRRHARADDMGLWLNRPDQPAVRVSCGQAETFCAWLSKRTGKRFALPTEAQWEYACRAGTATALAHGGTDADFAPWANVADRAFSRKGMKGGKQVTGGVEHLVVEGARLADNRFDDRAVVTAPVGARRPNAWGLFDMHGNAAEWTRTAYRPYPYRDGDGRDDAAAGERRVVRGGSFYDPPARCRSAFRLAYPPWRRIFNVGFRVVCPAD